MSEVTERGRNIAIKIPDGRYDKLTLADVWYIVDRLHTHFMDTNRDTMIFEKWMRVLETLDKDLPV